MIENRYVLDSKKENKTIKGIWNERINNKSKMRTKSNFFIEAQSLQMVIDFQVLPEIYNQFSKDFLIHLM